MIHVNSLYFGELIQSVLTNDAALSSLIGTKVFPLVAENGTTFPFIVYSRTNTFNQTNNKDGWFDTINFDITVAANTYASSIEVAQAVRNCVEHKKLSNNKLELESILLTNISEAYNDETYMQTLTYSATAML